MPICKHAILGCAFLCTKAVKGWGRGEGGADGIAMSHAADEERIPTIKQAKAAEAADADPLTGQKRQRAEAIAAQKEKIAKAAQEAKEKKKKEEVRITPG